MLNRRHIREKVLKTLYAFFQSGNSDIQVGEKELFHSIDKVYEIYLIYMSLLSEFRDAAETLIHERKQKHLPTAEDLNPSLHFMNNRIVEAVVRNSALNQLLEKNKVNWTGQQDLIRKLFMQFRTESTFVEYLAKADVSFEDDREIVFWIFETIVFPSELFEQLLEERSIYWLDEIELMQSGVLKTIKQIKQENSAFFTLLPLQKESDEDRKFAKELFRLTIANSDEFQEEISKRAANWEIERVAKMDIILMKMAICELCLFPSIPVKVTLDEYIELSKDYSSPQSKNFINGILDKIVADFKQDKRIQKVGRGLVE
jgi:N utilization substance protein B